MECGVLNWLLNSDWDIILSLLISTILYLNISSTDKFTFLSMKRIVKHECVDCIYRREQMPYTQLVQFKFCTQELVDAIWTLNTFALYGLFFTLLNPTGNVIWWHCWTYQSKAANPLTTVSLQSKIYLTPSQPRSLIDE